MKPADGDKTMSGLSKKSTSEIVGTAAAEREPSGKRVSLVYRKPATDAAEAPAPASASCQNGVCGLNWKPRRPAA